MNQKNDNSLDEVYEVIGRAAGYLMKLHLPVNMRNISLLLRANEILFIGRQRQKIYLMARKLIMKDK